MVKIVMVRGRKQGMHVGMHLHNPTSYEINNAFEDAYAKGFETIWVHGRISRATAQRIAELNDPVEFESMR